MLTPCELLKRYAWASRVEAIIAESCIRIGEAERLNEKIPAPVS